MKNKKLYLALCVVAAIAAFVGILFWIFAPDSETVAAAGSVLTMFASAPIAASAEATVNPSVTSVNEQTSATDDFKRPEINKPTVSQTITKVMPSLYPLDTMLRELRTGKTKSDIYE